MARTCERCHRKMSPFVPRKKNEEGELLCEGCRNGREGRPLSRDASTPLIRAQAHQTPDVDGYLVKVAHGNMDGVTVFHCPFCGSGQVVNSGTSIECSFCHTNFSVLVQPQYPMMPQTVDGQPYTPGEDPNATTTPAGDGATEEDDDGSFGGDQLSEKIQPDDQDDKPEDGSNDKPAPDEAGKNPFAKDSRRMFITASGVALSEEEYMRHLALRFSPNREATLAEIHESV